MDRKWTENRQKMDRKWPENEQSLVKIEQKMDIKQTEMDRKWKQWPEN